MHPSTYLLRVLFQVNPESCQVNDQRNECNGKEFELQVERKNLQQHFNFRLDDGTEEKHFHQALLMLLALLSLA